MMTNLLGIIMVIIALILFSIFLSTNAIPSFGEQNNTDFTPSSNSSVWNISKTTSLNPLIDRIRPSVNITNPSYPPTVTIGKIMITGTASDSDSGILNVSAVAHTFPFDGHYRIKLASQPVPLSHNNWSHWSFPLVINKPGTYRLVITALDNAGNRNYAETTINAPILEKNNTQIHPVSKTTIHTTPKIAFVRPTFTEAAYQEHGFYRFYFKYGFPPFGKNITTDLDMLTVKTPRSVSEFPGYDTRNLSKVTSLIPVNGTELHDVSEGHYPNRQKFWMPFINRVQEKVPNATVTVMRDEDVHDGHIFYANGNNNKTNAYDVLLSFHNEYVTQSEYDNLRQFVKNGGTIVFIDANALYAEVRYDRDNHTITLVKGHNWEYDGKSARRSVAERWFNETKDWVGGNYLINSIKNGITFKNNPFNYTHFEENVLDNPRAKIIIDYGVNFPLDDNDTGAFFKEKKVATFSLDYGKGKVIMLGLSGRILAHNQKFMSFFDSGILPIALCPKFQSCSEKSETDVTQPLINITYPVYPPTVTTGKIILKGTASDPGSGIHNISAYISTFPFDGKFDILPASPPIPISHNNWSQWSVPLVINTTGTYRMLIEARDNEGNTNWAETTINAALPEKNTTLIGEKMIPKIAFVRPTFTEAAYQEHGFYRFYFKYPFPPFGKNITTDLDMLTVKTPRSVPEFQVNDPSHMSNITALIPINGTELHDVSWDFFPNPQKFWMPVLKLVEEYVPNSTVTVMRDEDVHDGHIFYANGNNNNTNAYDVLLLFHNEYVTQSEYDNLRQFVKNGGTIVFIDANALYGEVHYDKENHTITLVKGHSWEFDGKSARRSVPERWYNETKDWVGSNFLVNDIKENITFKNNPFNYTHFEEQFVNNPRDEIIIDYGIKLPKDYAEVYSKKNELPADKRVKDIVVATYQLKYGKGKVIVLGLSGGTLVQNQAGILVDNQIFKKYFLNVILPRALCPKVQSCHF